MGRISVFQLSEELVGYGPAPCLCLLNTRFKQRFGMGGEAPQMLVWQRQQTCPKQGPTTAHQSFDGINTRAGGRELCCILSFASQKMGARNGINHIYLML